MFLLFSFVVVSMSAGVIGGMTVDAVATYYRQSTAKDDSAIATPPEKPTAPPPTVIVIERVALTRDEAIARLERSLTKTAKRF
jgi:hypothetical protein